MVLESPSLSTLLTRHASGLQAYAALDAKAAVIGHTLRNQAARLEAFERDSGRVESYTELLRERSSGDGSCNSRA